MRFYLQKYDFYESEVAAVYQIHDRVKSDFACKVNAIIHPKLGLFFRQLFVQRTDKHLFIFHIVTLTLSFLFFLLIVPKEFNNGELTLAGDPAWIMILVLFATLLVHFLGTVPIARKHSRSHYLLFQGDKLIVYGNKHGRQTYPVKDLKFIVIRDLVIPGPACSLWVELPMPDLPDNERKFMIESTASETAMNAVLRSLLPLLCGDDTELRQARRTRYVPFPWDYLNFMLVVHNIMAHLSVAYSRYFISHVLFFVVNGSMKSIFRQEEFLLGEETARELLKLER